MLGPSNSESSFSSQEKDRDYFFDHDLNHRKELEQANDSRTNLTELRFDKASCTRNLLLHELGHSIS